MLLHLLFSMKMLCSAMKLIYFKNMNIKMFSERLAKPFIKPKASFN